jgi:hypothetical protein
VGERLSSGLQIRVQRFESAPGLQHFVSKTVDGQRMPPKGPKDIHFLVALREKNPWVGRFFFVIGVLLFGYLLVDLMI